MKVLCGSGRMHGDVQEVPHGLGRERGSEGGMDQVWACWLQGYANGVMQVRDST